MNRPMNNNTVNPWQMSMMFFALTTGSSIVNIPAPLTAAARNAAWISILAANLLGLLLLLCVLYVHRKYPDHTLIGYSRILLGNWLTVVIALLFIWILTIMVTGIIVDAGAFVSDALLEETPDYVMNFVLLLLCALTARAGIEVMARMFTPLVYLMLFFTMLTLILIFPYYRPGYLLPVMPDGIKPFLHGVYIICGFPYSEIIIFSLILPFVKKASHAPLRKFMMLALFVNAYSLTSVVVASIMAMGPLSSELKYSAFQLARLISVEQFVERVEVIIAVTLIAGSYMKGTVALFALNLALSELLKLQGRQILIFPLALFCFLFSLTMIEHMTEFDENVNVIWPLFIFVTGVIPFLVITVAAFLKRRRAGSENS